MFDCCFNDGIFVHRPIDDPAKTIEEKRFESTSSSTEERSQTTVMRKISAPYKIDDEPIIISDDESNEQRPSITSSNEKDEPKIISISCNGDPKWYPVIVDGPKKYVQVIISI